MAARVPAIARWTARSVALLAVAFTCSRAARAANDCPWLNEATAAGILDGNATGLYVAATPDKPGSCTFTEIASGETHQLIIVVEVAASPHQRMMALEHACTSPSEPLAAIGNEAVHCAAMPRGKPHGELIIGRVRDQVFTIAITSTAKNDPVLEPHELAMRSQTAAEEVSGNLF